MDDSTHTGPPVSFTPVGGTLAGSIWEDSLASLPPRLTYDLVLRGAAVEERGAVFRPELQLELLALDNGSWRGLAGREYTFPRERSLVVQDGEEFVYGATGSLSTPDASYWVAPLWLELGDAREGDIEIRLRVRVAASVDEEPGPDARELEVEARVEIGPVSVLGDVGQGTPATLSEAAALAARFLAPGEYGDPVEEGDVVRLHPKPGQAGAEHAG